jgi:hypothetical protein
MKAQSFTDCKGRKGIIGDRVYSWTYFDGVPSEDRIRTVEDIVRSGAAGTKIKLLGQSFYTPSSNYIIVPKE